MGPAPSTATRCPEWAPERSTENNPTDNGSIIAASSKVIESGIL
jgi:hypothetical protein